MKQVSLAITLLAAAGCNTEHVARLDEGSGLGEGSRVLVSGVHVGAVTGVRVVEGHVDITFEIDSDHEITLREDACAMAAPSEGATALIVRPGTGAAREDQEAAIAECRVETAQVNDVFRELGEGMGDLLRQLGRGLFEPRDGQGGPSAPLPIPLPLPLPRAEPESCAGVTIRVDGVDAVPRQPVHLPQGGHRVWFELHNANTFPMRIGGVSDASFMSGDGRVLEPDTVPGEGWFMPFELPADARQRVSVIFPGDRPAPVIERIEVRQSSPADDPLSWCTISNR